MIEKGRTKDRPKLIEGQIEQNKNLIGMERERDTGRGKEKERERDR